VSSFGFLSSTPVSKVFPLCRCNEATSSNRMMCDNETDDDLEIDEGVCAGSSEDRLDLVTRRTSPVQTDDEVACSISPARLSSTLRNRDDINESPPEQTPSSPYQKSPVQIAPPISVVTKLEANNGLSINEAV
jgi:hypothetical protein